MQILDGQVGAMHLRMAIRAQQLAFLRFHEHRLPRPIGYGSHIELELLVSPCVVKFQRAEVRLIATAAATSSEQLNELPLSACAALFLHPIDLVLQIGAPVLALPAAIEHLMPVERPLALDAGPGRFHEGSLAYG